MIQHHQAIEVTQDGIGRILFASTPPDITALYTEGLQTCLAFILKGDKGISLIHNTGLIKSEIIENELQMIGKICSYAVVFNPGLLFYPNKLENSELKVKSTRLNELLNKHAPSLLQQAKKNTPLFFYEAKDGYISVDRSGKINTVQKPVSLLPLPNKDKRNWINILNNYFSINHNVNGDIQYDGKTYTECSKLDNTLEEFMTIANKNQDPTGMQQLRSYAVKHEIDQYNKWIVDEVTTSIDIFDITNKINAQSGYPNKNSKEECLLFSTSAFFQGPMKSDWIKYPENKLSIHHKGHDIRYFSLPINKNPKEFCTYLGKEGFSAKVVPRNQDEKLVVVDLTNSLTKSN